jgi:hypothetical protein
MGLARWEALMVVFVIRNAIVAVLALLPVHWQEASGVQNVGPSLRFPNASTLVYADFDEMVAI